MKILFVIAFFSLSAFADPVMDLLNQQSAANAAWQAQQQAFYNSTIQRNNMEIQRLEMQSRTIENSIQVPQEINCQSYRSGDQIFTRCQ